MSKRIQGKELRRSNIISAARDLIRTTEKTGFTMRSLAECAEVDVVTLYNLFGSKQAILHVLLDEDIKKFTRQLSRSKADPLNIFFRAVSLLKKYYNRERDYYRSMLSAVYIDGGTDSPSMFRGPRWELWLGLVEKAVTDGYLSKDVNNNALSSHLASLLFIQVLEWVGGDISLREMEIRTHYGFALSLHSIAMPEYQQQLYELFMESQKKMTNPRLVNSKAKVRKSPITPEYG